MNKRTILALVMLSLVLSLAGCLKAKPSEPADSPAAQATAPAAAAPATQAPAQQQPTATLEPAMPTPTAAPAVAQPTAAPEGPQGPESLAPPDGLAATLFDLMWKWETPLGQDQWYEVQIQSDQGGKPVTYWLTETTMRITSAALAPGRYLWKVAVVQGRDEKRGQELSPWSEEQAFIIVRPSVKAQLTVTPPPPSTPPEDLPDLGDAPSQGANLPAGAMTAYPAGGPAGVAAQFHTIYDPATEHFGPIHMQPRKGAWLGKLVTGEENAQVGADQDGVNNIDVAADVPDRDKGDDGLIIQKYLRDCYRTTFDFRVTFSKKPEVKEYYLNAWFDWDRNGKWGDELLCGSTKVDEWAVKNQPVTYKAAGTYRYTSRRFTAWNPRAEDDMWVRLTLSEKPLEEDQRDGRGPSDGYKYGETEDHYLPGALATATPQRYYVTVTPMPPATPTATPTAVTPVPTVPSPVPTVPTPQPTVPTPIPTVPSPVPTVEQPTPYFQPTPEPTTGPYPNPTTPPNPTAEPTAPYPTGKK